MELSVQGVHSKAPRSKGLESKPSRVLYRGTKRLEGQGATKVQKNRVLALKVPMCQGLDLV